MKEEVRTLATVAKCGVSACSVAVVFSALICLGGISTDYCRTWAGGDRHTNGAEARLCRYVVVVDIVYYRVVAVDYLAGVYTI